MSCCPPLGSSLVSRLFSDDKWTTPRTNRFVHFLIKHSVLFISYSTWGHFQSRKQDNTRCPSKGTTRFHFHCGQHDNRTIQFKVLIPCIKVKLVEVGKVNYLLAGQDYKVIPKWVQVRRLGRSVFERPSTSRGTAEEESILPGASQVRV